MDPGKPRRTRGGEGPAAPPSENTFGGRLWHAMQARGIKGVNKLDQELHLAQGGRPDVKPSSYATRFLSNKRKPSYEILELLLKILNVSADYLILGTGPRPEVSSLPETVDRQNLRWPRMISALAMAADEGYPREAIADFVHWMNTSPPENISDATSPFDWFVTFRTWFQDQWKPRFLLGEPRKLAEATKAPIGLTPPAPEPQVLSKRHARQKK